MPRGYIPRRNTRQTVLHHLCGHDTQNFNLDCFTTGRVRKLEAGPCRNCRQITTTAQVMSLVLGTVISGRFVEDPLNLLIDDDRIRVIAGAGEQIVIFLPKLYPWAIATRHETEGEPLYTVIYRPAHVKVVEGKK